MSTTVISPQISAAITATLKSGAAPAPAQANVSDLAAISLTVGSAAGNANAIYSAALTLASASNNDIDLTTLTDPLGNAITFASITGYKLTNNGTTGQVLTIGGGTNPIIASAEASEPVQALGGFRCEYFPDTALTVDSTHKIFRVAATGGGTVNYTITILGHT